MTPSARRSSGLLAAVLLVSAMGTAAVGPAGARAPTSVLSPSQVQAKQWWIVRLALHQAWRITRGKGVTVAVLDTGVDKTFGDLRGAVVPGFTTGGVPGDGTSDTDKALHGTRIADEIAGRGTGFGLLGVAPQAHILPVVVQADADPADAASALTRLAGMSHPPQVANMSFGGPFPCPAAVATATRRAADAGIVLVAAAGNSGSVGNPAEYPADCPGVVAVGAINNNGGDWSDTERGSYVSVAGPGVHMIGYDRQAASGFGYADGTSDAAAIVSGSIALLRARFPSMTPRDIVTRLFATARQFDGKQGTRNRRSGFGVARPYDALTGHVRAGAPNPVYDALGSGTGGAGGSGHSGSPSATPTGTPGATATSAASGATASPPASHPAPAAGSGSGTSAGVVIGIGLAVLAVLAVVVGVVLRSRRRAMLGAGRSGPPPGYGPPGPGRG